MKESQQLRDIRRDINKALEMLPHMTIAGLVRSAALVASILDESSTWELENPNEYEELYRITEQLLAAILDARKKLESDDWHNLSKQ